MHSKDFFEGLVRELSEDQLSQIRQHFTDRDAEFVAFKVTVCNAFATVSISFTDTPEEIDPDTWNGYDVTLPLDDVVDLIMKYDL